MRPQAHEITFAGQAGSTLRAEFDDCEVTVGPATTTLRAELPPTRQPSPGGPADHELGLKVIDVHRQLRAEVTVMSCRPCS